MCLFEQFLPVEQSSSDCALQLSSSLKPAGSIKFRVSDTPTEVSICGPAYGPLPGVLSTDRAISSNTVRRRKSEPTDDRAVHTEESPAVETVWADDTRISAAEHCDADAETAGGATTGSVADDVDKEASECSQVLQQEQQQHLWWVSVFENVLSFYLTAQDMTPALALPLADLTFERGQGVILQILLPRNSSHLRDGSGCIELAFDSIAEREKWLMVLAQAALSLW